MMKNPSNLEYQGDTCVAATDWRGNRFCVGDMVMYCIGAGRGQMMAEGRVLHIRKNLSYPQIEIQVLTERTSGSWNNGKRTRPAWVNAMNITAIPQ